MRRPQSLAKQLNGLPTTLQNLRTNRSHQKENIPIHCNNNNNNDTSSEKMSKTDKPSPSFTFPTMMVLPVPVQVHQSSKTVNKIHNRHQLTHKTYHQERALSPYTNISFSKSLTHWHTLLHILIAWLCKISIIQVKSLMCYITADGTCN